MLRTVKSVRATLTALALIAAFVAVSVAPAFAAPSRPACAAAAHACCQTASLKTCCASRDRQSNPVTPAESRIQLAPTLVAAPAIFVVNAYVDPLVLVRPHTAPERAAPLDLPTLLSTLLI